MKISYISNSALPGSNANSLQIVKMCEQFTILNNTVNLIVPNTGLKNLNPYKFYGVKKKFFIKKIKIFKKFPVGLMYYLFSIVSIFYALKYKSDLIITRNYFVCFILTLIKKKCIFEFHHDMTMEGRIVRFILNNFNFLNSESVIKIIAITHSIKTHYINKYNVIKKKIIVLPSGTSLENTVVRINFKNKKLNIGYFGLVNNSRGLDLIINLSNIDKFNNYFIFGAEKKFIRNLQQKNFFSNLNVNGYISNEKIKFFINKMDILIMPYKKKVTSAGNIGDIGKYTSPLKLFDYLASGKVIIASEINVLKEVLKKNYNCVFVRNYANAFAWKNEIDKIKNNRVRRRLLSISALDTSKKYRLITRAKKYLDGIKI